MFGAVDRAMALSPRMYPSGPCRVPWDEGTVPAPAGSRAGARSPPESPAFRRWPYNHRLLSHRVFLGHVFCVRISPASLFL